MRHAGSEFEIKNSEGTSLSETLLTSSTIGQETVFPASPDKFIESFTIENLAPIADERSTNNNIDTEVQFSIDDGVNFDVIYGGQGAEVEPKGVRQIKFKSNESEAAFRLTVNFEKFNEDR